MLSTWVVQQGVRDKVHRSILAILSCSTMSQVSTLANMGPSSCLQQRDSSGYPYMLHDPLSLSGYSRACNPTQSAISSHSTYVPGGSTAASTGNIYCIFEGNSGTVQLRMLPRPVNNETWDQWIGLRFHHHLDALELMSGQITGFI